MNLKSSHQKRKTATMYGDRCLIRLTDAISDSMDMNLCKFQEMEDKKARVKEMDST